MKSLRISTKKRLVPSRRLDGSRNRADVAAIDKGGPRCIRASRGPLSSSRRRNLISVPRFTKDVSGLQQLSFETHSRLAFTRPDLDTISNCRRYKSAGCLANDRPETHTVILRLARSFILARWRHSISSRRVDPADTTSASLPRSHDHMVRSEFLPRSGAVRSVMPRQVQHLKIWSVREIFQ